MNLDAKSLAMSFGIVTAALWTICSVLVALMPGPTMTVMAHMLHGDAAEFSWTMTWTGFFIGLVSWTLSAAAAGWLIGWFYNRFAYLRSAPGA